MPVPRNSQKTTISAQQAQRNAAMVDSTAVQGPIIPEPGSNAPAIPGQAALLTDEQVLASAMAQAKKFGSTLAALEKAPKQESKWLTKTDLIGVNILIMAPPLGPVYKYYEGRAYLAATYTIMIPQRPDLGQRYIDLTCAKAIAQANAHQAKDFPLLASIGYDPEDNTGGKRTPGIVLLDPLPDDQELEFVMPSQEDTSSSLPL